MRRLLILGFFMLLAAPIQALKPALLVIDVQDAFLPYMSELDVKRAPEMINGAIWLFRQHNLPVIRVYHVDPQWGPAEDSEGFKFLASIAIKDEDPRIIKHYPNAFNKTELEDLLRDLGCDTVVLCGLSATGCVLATYHGALDRDLKVMMVKDALISPEATHTDVVEDFCESVGLTTLQLMLESVQP